MKVTRTIREFIEQQVEIKEKQALEPFMKKKEDAIQRAKKDFEKLEKEMNSMLKPILDKYNIKESLCVHCPRPEYYLPEIDEYNEERRKIYDKKRSMIVELIAEMELGGTKAELMERINSIQF